MCNLIQIMVAKVTSDKQKAGLQHTHGRCGRNSIKVFQLDFRYNIIVSLESDLENITLLGLHKEKIHGLGAMCSRADEDHTTFRIVEIVASTWNGTADVILVAQIFVCEIILGADQNAGRTIIAARNGNKKISVFLERFRIFPDNVVETEIEFVKGECLLCSLGSFAYN